jgi:hypothetical protein
MQKFRADVDIDLRTDFNPLEIFPNWSRASIIRNELISPHVCGVYPQAIAIDPISKLSAIHYEDADDIGYFKLDFLHNSVYNHFNSREEILELINLEPDWSLLIQKEQVVKLFQMSKHFDLLIKLQPKTIDDLADAIALIRPGKSGLINLYLAQKESVRKMLYSQSEEFSFKKSHSYSYAMVIILQLHLISLGLL